MPGTRVWGLRALAFIAPALLLGTSAAAQEVVPVALTLDEAIEIALQNSPAHLQVQNNEGVADWDVRSAYGQWIPSASLGGSIGWQGAGEERFGSITSGALGLGTRPSIWSSSYSLRLSYNLSGNTLLAPGQAQANRNAARAQTAGSAANIAVTVTRNYIDVLRQAEQVEVSERQLERARFNFRLAQAQREVGTASAVDEAQAQVNVSRAEVTLLTTENALEAARIRLMQSMGVDVHRPATLTTPFDLSEPYWEESELVEQGLEGNPTLLQLRGGRSAQAYAVRMAKSAYLPSLSFSAGWSGFSQQLSSVEAQIAQAEAGSLAQIQNCLFTNDLYSRLADPLPAQDCTRLEFTDAAAQAIRDANDVFPFSFTNQPPSASVSVSIPIFQGFSRQRSIEAAQAALEDSDLSIRQSEIALRADIAVNLASLRAAYEAAVLEQRNQTVVDEQLRLARERFSVGLAPFQELLEAETLKVEADRTLVAAIFAYHDALANLEATIGTSLRD